MDTHTENIQAFDTNHYSSANAEINIDSIIAAIAGLNCKILRLRKEIVAFKNENKTPSTMMYNSSRPTPSGFNDSTKNDERRTGVRYELQRNFKGNDSPGGTDLSARLSFTKRAREVKAASEAAVFKEDYPRDDKSIEDDERPNRSRLSEPLGTYRKSISDAEKFGKETGEKSKKDVRNIGDARTSYLVDEKLKKPNKYQNEVSDIHRDCGLRNVITAKMKKKRISRGVQYDISVVRRSYVDRFFQNCLKSKSKTKKCNLAQEIEKEKIFNDKKKFDVGLQNDITNKSLSTIIFNNEFQALEENTLITNMDIKKEKFEKNENKTEKIIGTNNCEKRKKNDNSKNHKISINLLEKLWLNKALKRNINPKVQENRSQHNFNIVDDSQNNKKEIAEPYFGNNRMNDAREKSQSRWWDVKIFDRKVDSNDACKNATANSDKERDVNEVKRRLDLCIAELNDIISDACVIFNSAKSSAKKSS